MAREKFRNLSGLAVGFAAGQGATLLAYSYLIAEGNYETVTLGGVALAIFSLLQQIVDYGGFLFLTRISVKSKLGNKSADVENRLITSLIIIRITIFLLLIIIGATIASLLRVQGFTFWSMIGVIPGLGAWCFNQQGRMDAFDKAGAAGMLNALPWLLSALALLFLEGMSPMPPGLLLGGAYSFGLILAAGAHAATLSRLGVGLKLITPSKIQVRLVANLCGAILMTWIPGQLLARVQLALSGRLPENLSSGFVLGRNILNASTSIQFMINRVEFPTVCAKLKANGTRTSIREALALHRAGIGFGAVSLVAMAMTPLLAAALPPSTLIAKFEYSAKILLMLSPLSLVTAINSALSQTIHASGGSKKLLIHNYIASAVGIAICILLVKSNGVFGLLIGSLTSAIIQFTGCAFVLYRR